MATTITITPALPYFAATAACDWDAARLGHGHGRLGRHRRRRTPGGGAGLKFGGQAFSQGVLAARTRNFEQPLQLLGAQGAQLYPQRTHVAPPHRAALSNANGCAPEPIPHLQAVIFAAS